MRPCAAGSPSRPKTSAPSRSNSAPSSPPDDAARYRPRYNIAPTDAHWILRTKQEERQLLPAKWGLVNSWAADAKGAFKQINARAETAMKRAAFRDAFVRRRCIVPADGFFEWSGPKTAGDRSGSTTRDGGLLYFAGLYESWRDPATDVWQRTLHHPHDIRERRRRARTRPHARDPAARRRRRLALRTLIECRSRTPNSVPHSCVPPNRTPSSPRRYRRA